MSVVVHDPEEPVGPLTAAERKELNTAEVVIQRGWNTFMEVGSALLEIRTKRLYRERYETFQSYVTDRWDWPVSRAYQQMQATEAVRFLEASPNVEVLPKKTSSSRGRSARCSARAPRGSSSRHGSAR